MRLQANEERGGVRRRAKVDGNQAEIVEALRQIGCSVQSLASVGDGCPDLLVGYRGRNVLVEVKRAKGRITEDQWRWRNGWVGQAAIVRTVTDAVNLIAELKL